MHLLDGQSSPEIRMDQTLVDEFENRMRAFRSTILNAGIIDEPRDLLLGDNRVLVSRRDERGATLLTLCHFASPDKPYYGRYIVHSMTGGTGSLDQTDEKARYVDPWSMDPESYVVQSNLVHDFTKRIKQL